MQVYAAPIRDMKFVVHELHNSAAHLGAIGAQDVNAELIDSVLEEAAKFAQGVMLPINASGDSEGCVCENGVVRTPSGFPEAYRQFCEGGWNGLACNPEYGGQGLPEILGKMVEEMFCSANLSLSLYPVLTRGAVLAIENSASDELKALYLPKMVEGSWSGTMNLTEPQSGTDLGLLRTRAVPAGDGTYRVTGSKIFITGGEHDLAENIVHLVLARLPDAPRGVKGISMFLVPKYLPDGQGNPGMRNAVSCAAVEHKMGLKGSATCQLNFDEAVGWLVGEPNKGLSAMFVMMNAERISVGLQGLGILEIAYQSAVAYARERLQGRAPTGAAEPERAADPIIVHPDVRRMLMNVRVAAEGCRALSGWMAAALDLETRALDAQARERAADFVAFMTPVVKATFTDLGFELSSQALQVYGGHGYIRDHGMEQLVRDARIAMIYEGTNGVQAMDLAGRKLTAKNGAVLAAFKAPIAAYLAQRQGAPEIQPLADAFARFETATAFVLEAGGRDPEEIGAAAADYLRLTGLVAQAYLWARAAEIAAARVNDAGPDQDFYRTKIACARYFNDRVLPQTAGLLASIVAGKGALMELAAANF